MYDEGTATPFILTYAAQGTRLKFSQSLQGSSTSALWTGWRNYTLSVPYDMMSSAIVEMNSKYGGKFDPEPSNWSITLVAIQGEIIFPQGTDGRMGWSVKGLKLESKP